MTAWESGYNGAPIRPDWKTLRPAFSTIRRVVHDHPRFIVLLNVIYVTLLLTLQNPISYTVFDMIVIVNRPFESS